MKKAVILGERRAGLIDVPDPQPKEDWTVVKVHASALCTEYKSYLLGRPLNLGGHEGVGEVVAVAQPGTAKIGDRVVILPNSHVENALYAWQEMISTAKTTTISKNLSVRGMGSEHLPNTHSRRTGGCCLFPKG